MLKLVLSKLLANYGSVLILILLCGYYCVVTRSEQHPVTPRVGRDVARAIVHDQGQSANVVIITRDTKLDHAFANAASAELESVGVTMTETINVASPYPAQARKAIQRIVAANSSVTAILTHHSGAQWGPLRAAHLRAIEQQYAYRSKIRVYQPVSYIWPSFLTRENLLNVLKNNSEIAIIAIGMTLVIITAGIDLSVGSVLALSGVITAVTIQGWAGGSQANLAGVVGCCLIGIGVAASCGAFSGIMITFFHVPPFIVTLSLLMIARGLALIVAVGYQKSLTDGTTAGTPEAIRIKFELFAWLSNGETLGIPNPIILMLVLFVIAHVLMSRTPFGRYVYAVGGNAEAARLSGVPVVGVIILVYAICGAMTGLGGIVDASRFVGGRPNAGELYELQVIAAVVVGGTSLAGGEGRIFGTLIGFLIIAVIQNGLNIAGVGPYERMVVFGGLILTAVILDRLKKQNWTWTA